MKPEELSEKLLTSMINADRSGAAEIISQALAAGIDGLVGVIAGSKDDLSEARRLLGPDLNIIGNLDNLSMPAASAEQVYEMSIACLKAAAPSGHYILANAGADMPQATPSENLRAMQAAAAAYSAENGCVI